MNSGQMGCVYLARGLGLTTKYDSSAPSMNGALAVDGFVSRVYPVSSSYTSGNGNLLGHIDLDDLGSFSISNKTMHNAVVRIGVTKNFEQYTNLGPFTDDRTYGKAPKGGALIVFSVITLNDTFDDDEIRFYGTEGLRLYEWETGDYCAGGYWQNAAGDRGKCSVEFSDTNSYNRSTYYLRGPSSTKNCEIRDVYMYAYKE